MRLSQSDDRQKPCSIIHLGQTQTGVFMGEIRGKPVFGYTTEGDEYVPDDNWETARGFVRIYFEEKNIRKAVERIFEKYKHKWSASGLRNWLINPVLRGHTKQGDEIKYNTHQVLVTPDEDALILELLEKGRKAWGKNATNETSSYPLKGLIFCAGCGNPCYRHFTSAKVGKTRCRNRDSSSVFCDNRTSTSLELIEKAVIGKITAKAKEVQSLAQDAKSRRFVKSMSVIELEKFISNLKKAGDHPAILEAIAKIEDKIKKEENETNYQITSNHRITQELLTILAVGSDYWESLSEAVRAEKFAIIVKRVEVKNGEVVKVELTI